MIDGWFRGAGSGRGGEGLPELEKMAVVGKGRG
jgi:hypothetical protein